MYKIFINDKPLFLVDDHSGYQVTETNILVDFHEEKDLVDGMMILEEQPAIEAVMIFHSDLQELWTLFISRYTIIEAAGGLVKNTIDEHLLIFRNGKWDLPKGKLENFEAPNVAALREVEEECGITAMTIIDELPPTYHTYNLHGTHILKLTHWFFMSYSGNETPVPQLDEGIVKAEWLDAESIQSALSNSYGSVREMLSKLKSRKD